MAAMLFKWLTLCSLWLGGANAAYKPSGAGKHPFYISVTEINHNATDKTLEISAKVFADDLEQILEKNYKTTLDITTAKDQPRFNQLLPDYFSKHLVLVVDGKPVKLTYIGYETEKESAHCYFQVDHIATVKKIEISNSILYDFIDSETNIMHVTVNGTRKSGKVSYPEKDAVFQF